MRARVTAKTSLFYGEEGEVIRSSHGLSSAGESQFIVYLDRNSMTGDPYALPFFGDEIRLIDEGEEGDDDTVETHYSGLEWLEEKP